MSEGARVWDQGRRQEEAGGRQITLIVASLSLIQLAFWQLLLQRLSRVSLSERLCCTTAAAAAVLIIQVYT